MQLVLKQRAFSWFDSYEVYDENGNAVFSVRGEPSFGHQLRIFDAIGQEAGLIRERVFSFRPRFEVFIGGNFIGTIEKQFRFGRPRFTIDFKGWRVEGNWFEWDYSVWDPSGYQVAMVNKERFRWVDTYYITVPEPCNVLPSLMLALAIDAEKCSRGYH